MGPVATAIRYAACASAATSLNLAAQWLTFHLYPGIGDLAIGLSVGTIVGLVSKYLLDKFLVFDDPSIRSRENLHKFGYYCITGVATTAIFWSAETAFALVGRVEAIRYIGAVIGLSIGYFIKFHLDRRYVFRVQP
jgi:putative flippase GtrA